MVSLALADIQGNILRGYGFPLAAYLFLEVSDADAGRAFLHEIVDEITSADEWATPPPTTTNVALTYMGLRALGVAGEVLHELPAAFMEPMRHRAPRVLADAGRSAPEHWVAGVGTDRSHILVMIGGSRGVEQRAFEEKVTSVLARADSHGLRLLHRREAQGLVDAGGRENRREHFGWADGYGQPSIEGVGDSRAGQGVPQKDGITWLDLKAGEFILGYPDEDGQTVDVPLLRNGTYMVYRQLYQDVARFRRELYAEGAKYAETLKPEPALDRDQLYELMAAKVVGRWRDGEAIELSERRPEAVSRALGEEAQDHPDNDFRYEHDAAGLRCPRGAHIRRTNPRDTLAGGGEMSKTHRIIRRGMPYGPFLPSRVTVDDGQDRGLIFICLNADFGRQFELIQSLWCNDGNAFGLSNDKDYLLGDNRGTGQVTIQGDPPHFAKAQPDIVLTRGCEYLLVPGISALRDLAGS